MSRIFVISLLLLLLSFSTVFALDKGHGAQATLLKEMKINEFQAVQRLATGEVCSANLAGDPNWFVYYWLQGDEQYLAYQDPSLTCTAPYPFAVYDAYMLLYFENEAIAEFSATVQSVDLTDPSCPVPGDTLSTSLTYRFQFKPAGLWRIAIPAYNDTTEVPPEVNGPYFIGFNITTYFGDSETQDTVVLITEDYLAEPWTCQNYNIWDPNVGYVDLGNNNGFPGKLLLHSVGITGGSGGLGPMPQLTFLEPKAGKKVGAPLTCWVWDSQDGTFVDSVRFEYALASVFGWNRFGVTGTDNHALRNGVDPSGTGPGYVLDLGTADLIEDTVDIRATAYDKFSRTSSTQIEVILDPTPPRMDFIKPLSMEIVCLPYTFTTFTDDEDILSVKYYQKKLSTDFSVSVVTLHQTDYGDVDFDAGDGNPVAEGEFGEYYCGPTAGAIAVKHWFNLGYTPLMREFGRTIPLDTVVERLASEMHTRTNNGTYDDFFVGGLQNYSLGHGDKLLIESYFTPDYMDVREIFEEKEMLPILGLSGNPGMYVVLSAFIGLDNGGQYAVTISDPITGTLIDTYMRNGGSGSQMMYDGSWRDIDIVIAVGVNLSINSRIEFGEASKSASNWIYNWESSASLSDDSLYYITSIGTDELNRTEVSTTLIRYQCNLNRVKGDYDGNDAANSMDILALIDFIYQDGTIPIGGAHRADANCDNQIDIGDVIFMIKYIWESGETPCY